MKKSHTVAPDGFQDLSIDAELIQDSKDDQISRDRRDKEADIHQRKTIISVPAPVLSILFKQGPEVKNKQLSTGPMTRASNPSYLCYIRTLRPPHSLLPLKTRKVDSRECLMLHSINTQQLHAAVHESRYQDQPEDTVTLQRVYAEHNLVAPRDWHSSASRVLTFGCLGEGNNLFAGWALNPTSYLLEVLPDTNSWVRSSSNTTSNQLRHFGFWVEGGIRGKTYTFHVPNFDSNQTQIHPVYSSRRDPTKPFSKWKRCPGRTEYTLFDKVS